MNGDRDPQITKDAPFCKPKLLPAEYKMACILQHVPGEGCVCVHASAWEGSGYCMHNFPPLSFWGLEVSSNCVSEYTVTCNRVPDYTFKTVC